LYNTISLKYLLPAGGEDLDTMRGDLELAVAGESEPEVILLGESVAHRPEVGEVIYKDSVGAICRRWNWKEADRTKLTFDTKNAFLVIEALPPVPRNSVEAAINELADLVKQYCGGTVSTAFLDKNNREVNLI